MHIAKFEYYHGVVLTKLLRKDSKPSLTLIESEPKENWAQYVISTNIATDIAITIVFSASPREVRQEPRGTSWTFQIRSSRDGDANYRSYYALVGAPRDVGSKDAMICLLDPDQIKQLQLTERDRSVTVRKPAQRGQLIVFREKKRKFRVPQNAIETLLVKQ